MSGNGFDNLNSLRVCDEDIPTRKVETPASRRRQEQRRAFVMVPLEWSQRLARPTHAYTRAVLDCLLFLDWKGKGEPVILSNVALQAWGVSSRDKSRALNELEGLGLIAIERRKGRSPRITLFKPGRR
jgi:hypothetical protein